MTPRVIPWSYLGELAYPAAVERMEARRQRLLVDPADEGEIYLCCHPPTITLGRHADAAHLRQTRVQLAARGVAVEASSRGGDVTYHGPGQLMIYPVVRVEGVRSYLSRLSAAVIDIAAALGAPGCKWLDEPAGVWHGGRKIAACGLHLHRGVAIHGFALNLHTPASAWAAIVPCGLSSQPISIADVTGRPCEPAEAASIAGPLLAGALAPGRNERWRADAEAVWSRPRGSDLR